MNSISCVNASNFVEKNTVNTFREKAKSSKVCSKGSNDIKSPSSLENERTKDVRIAKLERKLENMEKMFEQSNRNQAWMEEMLILLIDEPPVVGKRKHLEIQKKLELSNHIDESASEDSTRHKRDDLQSIISQYDKEMKHKSEELDSLRTSYQLLETELQSLNIWKDEVEKQKKEIKELKEDNEMIKEQNNKLQKELDQAKSSVPRLSGSTAEVKIKQKKYLILKGNWSEKIFFDEQNTEIINYWTEPDISTNVSSYHKKMFVIADYLFFNPSSMKYHKFLSYCRQWKKLHSDGEIHVISWITRGATARLEPPTQLRAFMTSCKDLILLSTSDCLKELISFLASEWAEYSGQLLSEKTKQYYLL